MSKPMSKPVWQVEIPTEEGHYWFYGTHHDRWPESIYNKSGDKNWPRKSYIKIHHIEVTKYGGDTLHYSLGMMQMIPKEHPPGFWMKMTMPEIPNVKLPSYHKE